MSIPPFLRHPLVGITLLLLVPTANAQQKTAAPTSVRSAPITNIRYDLTFDSSSASRRTIQVAMSFDVGGPGPVLLSLPAWTPGAYEIGNFARWVVGFAPTGGDSSLTWDKLDYDTWRVQPGRSKSVTIRFDYMADSLDNAMAWARPDFAFFNGTNLFFYPEGRAFTFPAAVTIKTQAGWLVTTGMKPAQASGSYSATNYHDLVDAL